MHTGVLEAIDKEILRLQQVRALLGDNTELTAKRRGRPKGSTNQSHDTVVPPAPGPAKRTMSEEGRARIAAAQKRRWAAQKKGKRLREK